MNFQLRNARLFGRQKADLFDVSILNEKIVSIYPAGVEKSNLPSFDLQGAWVAPGFVDSHVHTTNTGVSIKGLDLSDCDSYEKLRERISNVPRTGSVILGHGWDDSKWDRSADIDLFSEISPPMYLSRVDAHSALASPRLIEMAQDELGHITEANGFDQYRPLRSEAHGEIREFAYRQISAEDRQVFIDAAIDDFLSKGIVEIHEMAGPRISSKEDATQLGNQAARKKMNLQLWWGELNGHRNAQDLKAVGCGGDLFIDGSIGSRTALLTAPYEDGGIGNKYISVEDATQHIVTGYEYNMPTSFHAIGDAAIEIATTAFENAQAILGKSNFSKLQHRIEHAELLNLALIERLIDLKVIFSMQPQFSQLWAGNNGMYNLRIGKRWEDLNPFRHILQKGGFLIFSSDSPVTNPNPWTSIAAAMNMHMPEYSLTYRSAFRAHTWLANRSNIEFGIGSTADLSVWDVDEWYQIEIDSIRNKWSTDARSFPVDYPDPTRPPVCLMTIVNGEIAYSKLDF